MKVIEKNIDDLIPYARNPRKLTDAQIDGIAASIQEFGYDAPIIVDKDNVIIAGHGRFAALRKLGHKKIKVIVQDKLTPAQAKARRLIDNKQTENREYDTELLALELEDLDIDLAQFGVDFPEMESLEGPTEPMSDAEINNMTQQFLVVAQCRDEAEQEMVFEKLKAESIPCKIIT